jgi:hypothetical protein
MNQRFILATGIRIEHCKPLMDHARRLNTESFLQNGDGIGNVTRLLEDACESKVGRRSPPVLQGRPECVRGFHQLTSFGLDVTKGGQDAMPIPIVCNFIEKQAKLRNSVVVIP